MPPDSRPLPRFIAEPPRDKLPYGRWADALRMKFVEACHDVRTEEHIGAPGEVTWFPDRTFGGRTYAPATCPTSTGFEMFGYVSYLRAGDESEEPSDFTAVADYTDETAEANPDWQLDLSDQEIVPWHGHDGREGLITLVWGVALVANGTVATAELGPTTTDQCVLEENRFTLVSLDDYTGDLLEVKLWGGGARELAAESLYEEEE